MPKERQQAHIGWGGLYHGAVEVDGAESKCFGDFVSFFIALIDLHKMQMENILRLAFAMRDI
jgi:hypothetical protein